MTTSRFPVCGDAVDYATALTELEACRLSDTTLALAATGGPLTDRVRRVLRLPVGDEPRPASWVVTLGLTLVLAGGSLYLPAFGANSNASAMTPGVAQDEPIASPDTFDWRVYPIGHFDVYYYPALEADLRPIADAAERAYQRISAELTYELADRVPLILFKTRDDFAQQGIVPEIPEAALRSGVSSFAEHNRNRVGDSCRRHAR